MGGIDDATGTVPSALFREQEDAHGDMLWLQQVVQTVGVPQALDVDRHRLHERHAPDPLTLSETRAGGPRLTQFGRVRAELGITLLTARSPQDAGRVERLGGTLQDRLGSELRLAQAQPRALAQQVLAAFLPGAGARVAVPAAVPGSAYRPLPEDLVAERGVCFT